MSFWGCLGWNRSSEKEAVDVDPVVLVSGMGGSILNSKPKNKFGLQTRVWVRILLADLEFKNKAWSLYNSNTGYTEVLDKNSELVVPGDDYGLYAIDILDPSPIMKCLHVTEVFHFHAMIDMLMSCGYKKGTTLFGYGYDFRQSNRIDNSMEGLKAKLETAYKASGGRKITLISHSMGGLLVSCFISLYSDVFEKYVNKWICIACPFQGAPGCVNDSLLTGLQFVDGFESLFFVSRWSMHQLVVECPSVYEMLGNPDFNWKTKPRIKVWRKQSKDEVSSVKLESYGPSECITVFEEALRNNELEYGGNKVALPFNKDILKWAIETRRVVKNAKLPQGVSFYNIYGSSFDTPFDVCYGTEEYPIEDLSEICHSIPRYYNVNGDGTVPVESAKADGFEAVDRVAVDASHRMILNNDIVFEYIQKWLGISDQKVTKNVKTSRVVNASSSVI